MRGKINAALTACSDALDISRKSEAAALEAKLREMDIETRQSPHMFAEGSPFAGTPKEKAQALNAFFADESITEIFDISGGDLANEVLPYLDFDIIARSRARFWGYSDLSTVLNAIYTKTGRQSVLFQVRHIMQANADAFSDALDGRSGALFSPKTERINGGAAGGVLVGGNIRCFLKLAGTEYFPDLCGKVLLLESLGGKQARIVTALEQLNMLGAFQKVNGVLLGTFTELDGELGREESLRLITSRILSYRADIPVAVTNEIGHAKNSLAVVIGGEISI